MADAPEGMLTIGEKVNTLDAEGTAAATCGVLLPTLAVSFSDEKTAGELRLIVTDCNPRVPLVVLVTVKLPAAAVAPALTVVLTGALDVAAPGKAATSLAMSGDPQPVTRS